MKADTGSVLIAGAVLAAVGIAAYFCAKASKKEAEAIKEYKEANDCTDEAVEETIANSSIRNDNLSDPVAKADAYLLLTNTHEEVKKLRTLNSFKTGMNELITLCATFSTSSPKEAEALAIAKWKEKEIKQKAKAEEASQNSLSEIANGVAAILPYVMNNKKITPIYQRSEYLY